MDGLTSLNHAASVVPRRAGPKRGTTCLKAVAGQQPPSVVQFGTENHSLVQTSLNTLKTVRQGSSAAYANKMSAVSGKCNVGFLTAQAAMGVQMQALQDGPLMRYCSGSTERPIVQQFIADFAMSQIRLSVETPDLLFQTSNEATAAWCYRMPEQLVSSDSRLNTAAAADWPCRMMATNYIRKLV